MTDIFKKNRVRSLFIVKEKVLLTPHYIRVIFIMSEEQIDLFRNVRVGGHNKILVVENEPAFAVVTRTYTTRRIDTERKELWIEFAAHGDNGPASFWAARAAKGSVLEIAAKEGNKPLLPAVNEYLLVGDSTAIPVISVMLEQLPTGANVKVILEVYSASDEMIIPSKANVSFEWVYNAQPETGSQLAEIVMNQQLPGRQGYIFVAAEYDTIKELKRYFREKLRLDTDRYSAVSYWKRGASEDQSSYLRQQQRFL